MNRRTNNSIDELLEEFDLEVWLDDQGVDYNVKHGRSGEQLNLKECPRCGGKDWKVFINRDTGVGNCFHGACVDDPWFNKVTFVAAHMGLENGPAVKTIRQFNDSMGWRPKVEKKQVKEVDITDLKLPESHELPTESGKNLKYLTDRGVTKEQTKKHGLRYSSNGYHEFVLNGEKKRQYFSGRVLIPVMDMEGNLVTFQGRDVTGESDRKYLMASGLPATGRYLYNAHNAVGAETAVLCEGVFSVYAMERVLEQNGIDGVALGTFGKTLSNSLDTDSQLSQLLDLKRNGLKTVYFMWDGEEKTIASAKKEAYALQKVSGLKCMVCELKDGHDPDSAKPSEVLAAFNQAKEVNWKFSVLDRLRK